jgi:hypothetical protein
MPILVIVAVIAGMLLPLIVILRPFVRAWDLNGVSATIMAIAAVPCGACHLSMKWTDFRGSAR